MVDFFQNYNHNNSGRRILLIDDDRDFVEAQAELLKEKGYIVKIALSYIRAQQIISEFDAQVAVIDLRLGKESGLDLIMGFKNVRPDILCLVLTGFAEMDSVVKALQKGADDYIRKSVEPDEFLAILDRSYQIFQLRFETKLAQAAKHQAEAKNRAKSAFLSQMSHELRTPLASIIGFTELLEADTDPSLSPQQKEQVQIIKKASNHLLDLVNTVLNLSKIESGYIEIAKEDLLLNASIDECTLLTQSLAKQRNIKFVRTNVNDFIVNIDRLQLTQILLNLFSNAVKYAKHNTQVQIGCEINCENKVKISVTDQGPGLNQTQLANIFSPFERLGAEQANIDGAGMGLAITKYLVELMGGIIGVESAPNIGSTFWIEFPGSLDAQKIHQHKSADKQPLNQTDEAAVIYSCNVLIVEDNLVNRQLFTKQLKLFGCVVKSAANGKEALKMLDSFSFDLLLTDCFMPEMNGYELTQTIRDIEKNRGGHLIIIAITADILSGVRQKCLAVGMDDYLAKPITMKNLKAVIQKWMPTVALDDGQQKKLHGTLAADDFHAPISLFVICKQVGNDSSLQWQLINCLVEMLPKTMVLINEACFKCDVNEVNFQVHKLNSTALSVGSIKLNVACQQLIKFAVDNDWIKVHQVKSLMLKLVLEIENYVNSIKPDHVTNSSIQEPVLVTQIEQELLDFKLLIVDDDVYTLNQLTIALASLGVTNIITSRGGEEALTILAREYDSINGVIVDIDMPKMDGIEFLRHFTEAKYQCGLVIMSGITNSKILKSVDGLAKGHRLNILATMEKPLTRQMLSTIISKFRLSPDKRSEIDTLNITQREIEEAIYKGEMSVVYQPLIDIQTGKVVGVEALSRWHNEKHGHVSPDIFIPLIEQSGLVDDFTIQVFDKAIKQIKQWHKKGLNFGVSINFFMDNFNCLDLPIELTQLCKQIDLNISNITIEVTESSLMHNMTAALEVLTRLRLAGFKLSIDDFGTGYASMEQLQRVPFSELKIDRAFVSGAANDTTASAILKTSIDLAKKLNLTTVAEGVETQSDLSYLANLGCDIAQGYNFAKPMTNMKFENWLINKDTKRAL